MEDYQNKSFLKRNSILAQRLIINVIIFFWFLNAISSKNILTLCVIDNDN